MAKTVAVRVRGGGDVSASRGVARFTAQLVALCVPDRKTRVLDLATMYEVSQASIMRAVIDRGLPLLEKELREGKVDPTTLA